MPKVYNKIIKVIIIICVIGFFILAFRALGKNKSKFSDIIETSIEKNEKIVGDTTLKEDNKISPKKSENLNGNQENYIFYNSFEDEFITIDGTDYAIDINNDDVAINDFDLAYDQNIADFKAVEDKVLLETNNVQENNLDFCLSTVNSPVDLEINKEKDQKESKKLTKTDEQIFNDNTLLDQFEESQNTKKGFQINHENYNPINGNATTNLDSKIDNIKFPVKDKTIEDDDYITFNNDLKVEKSFFNSFDNFYNVLGFEIKEFQETKINEQEAKKIKEYIESECEDSYISKKVADELISEFDLENKNEARNLIKRLEISNDIQEQLKKELFYQVIPKNKKLNIANKGKIKELIESCPNEETKKVLSNIKEVEIVYEEDKNYIKTKFKNQYNDCYSKNKDENIINIVYLDFSNVLITKKTMDYLLLLANNQDIDETTKFILHLLKFKRRDEFLKKFYCHIEKSGIVIPQRLIDTSKYILIKNPAQLNNNSGKFYDEKSLKDNFSTSDVKYSHMVTKEEIEMAKNWNKKHHNPSDNINSFENMKQTFFDLTNEKLGNFFKFVSDEKISLVQ